MSVSENVRKAMDNAGLSAAELSVKSGVPESRLSEIINGKTKNPQMKTLVKLANAMRVNVAVLTGGEIQQEDRTLEEIIDGLEASEEYKMGAKRLLKKSPEEILEWLLEEMRKAREAREKG
jgi:transcriptional regulator with XRE-family HTH domain